MENRLFKFRAWNHIVHKFEYFTLQDIEKQKGAIQWHILTIQQFTGLFDKNKREIYEGSLVKGCSFNGSYALGKVVYYEDSFIVVPIGKFIEGIDSITCDSIEVVGNIFEHKYLLV